MLDREQNSEDSGVGFEEISIISAKDGDFVAETVQFDRVYTNTDTPSPGIKAYLLRLSPKTRRNLELHSNLEVYSR